MDEPEKKYKKAVAVKYEPNKGVAPEIIAKGHYGTAERIIEVAKESKVHIVEDSNLVNELLKVDIGNNIPEELYQAVAKVLIFIEQMDNRYGISEYKNK